MNIAIQKYRCIYCTNCGIQDRDWFYIVVKWQSFETMTLSNNRNGIEADYNAYDQVLKKLETTKQVKAKVPSSFSQFDRRDDGGDRVGRRGSHTRRHHMSNDAVSSDSSHCEEDYNGDLETYEGDENFEDIDECEDYFEESQLKSQQEKSIQEKGQHDSTSMFIATYPGYQYTRQQTLVSVNDETSVDGQDSLLSFISSSRSYSPKLLDDGLPEAVLKLDRRHAIPRPRHRNDVLVEIEVSLFCYWQ